MKCFVTDCFDEAKQKNGLRIINRTVYYCDGCFRMVRINLSTYPAQRSKKEESAMRWKEIDRLVKKRRLREGGM